MVKTISTKGPCYGALLMLVGQINPPLQCMLQSASQELLASIMMLHLGDPVVVVALSPRGNMLSPLSIMLQGRGGPPLGGAWHAGGPCLLCLPQKHLLLMLLCAPCRQTLWHEVQSL